MDLDSSNGLLAALGLKLANVLAGALTSFASLRFFDGLQVWEKWTTFVGGWAIAAWGAAPVTEYFELKPRLEIGMALVLGLFGMSLTAAVVKLIKETDWGGIVRSIIDRRRNGGSSNSGGSPP